MRLRPGLVILTASGPVEVRGRNACRLWLWWGWPLQDGHPLRQRMRMFTLSDILAIQTRDGLRPALPGLLKEEESS